MLKKKFFKTKCKVTFEMPKEVEAKSVTLVGDFNDWDADATPMKQLKSGTWKTIVDLEKDQEFQFRYLIDGSTWENDWAADRYVPNNIDGENSVVVTHQN